MLPRLRALLFLCKDQLTNDPENCIFEETEAREGARERGVDQFEVTSKSRLSFVDIIDNIKNETYFW